MVFEGLVSDVLSRVLGEYVKNLNKDQLKIGIFGGNVSLTNLELKEDALANLPINLPIQVKKGFLGKLDLKVPWKDLKSKPVIINIDCIYALAVPQTQSYKYDEEEEKKKEQALKKKKIENYEWLKSIKDAEENEIASAAKDDSFTNRLVTKIIDNLQIVINKVHIRFENRNEIGKLYAVGLTLDKLSAQSTDDNWMPTFVDSSKTQMIKKLAVMDSFGFYIDENAESLENLPTAEFTKLFTDLIPTQASISLLRKYIIKPISSQLKLTINKSDLIDKAIPKILVDCILSQITCTLSAPQYQNILHILNFTNEFLRDMKYLRYRPTVTISQNAKAWWKYIGQATIDQIKLKRYQKSWAYMAERRKDRILYINLFKRSIPRVDWLTPLNKTEKSQLEQLDEKLSFEDIIFFRSLAYAEVKKETEKNKIRKQFLDEKRSERGFFTNLFSTAKKREDEQAAPIVQLSTEERDELYKTIEYNEVVQSVEEPPDWVKVVANLDVKGFALQLAENDMVFIEALYSGLSLKFEQRNEGIKLQAGIRLFEVYDQFTKKTHFPKIISAVATKSTGSFASAIVDTRPPDKSIDLFVELNVDPLNVIVTKPLILKVVDFFHDPSVDLTNISTRAGNHIVNFTERAKVQLQDAIDQHKVLALSVNIQAPVIVFPENVTVEKSNVLIVDLGSFKVRSDLSNSIKGKVVGSTTNEDDFYDKFNVSFEEIQVLLSDDIKGSLTSSKTIDTRSHIIQKFDIQLKIFSSIQQDSLTLTKLKISGELPRLDLHVSDKKVKQLLSLVSALTADMPGSGSAPAAPTTPKSPSAVSPTQSPPLKGSTSPTHPSQGNNLIDVNAPAPKQDNNMDILIKHKQLSCEFVIKSISITLSNQTSDLIKVQFCQLSVQYDQRTFDSIGCVSLMSLDIEDCFTKNSLKKLATSNPKDLDKSSNQSSLVKLDFKQFNQNSPEYDKKDMVVSVEFYSFYLVLNPSTINQLMVLLKSLESSQPKQSLNSSIPRAVSNVRRASEPTNTAMTSNTQQQQPTAVNPTITTTTTTIVNTGGNTRKRIIRTLRQVHVPKKKKPTEFVSIKFTAHIESLGVALNQDNDQMLGIFSINNFTTDVTMFKDTRMAVSGSLGSILLEDCTPSYSLYKQVIVPMHQSDKMLEFKYETFLMNLSNYTGYDTAVSAHVKSIVLNANIAFLLNLQNYFLGGMLDPILNADKKDTTNTNNSTTYSGMNKSLSMESIDEQVSPPSKNYSSSVSVDQQELLEKLKNQQPVTVTKMKLDIQIDTPVFVVPQSPKSKNTIQMELGKIVISNTFAYHDINQLPIDNMKILLQDTNISINSDLTQSNFLEKLNIELNLTRFLVPNKNPDVEDLVINLSITHFAFYLDENQYKFFLIMSDSLSKEMANATKQVETAKKLLSTNTEDKEKLLQDELRKKQQKQIDMQYFTENEVISKMGKATAKVNVYLKYVSFTITHKGDSIAHFIINGINVDLKNTDTNKTSFQVNMKSISLKDSRKDSRNLYKVLLENKMSQDDIKPFIQLGYLRDNTLGDQYINVTINDPHLFLSPTPLIMISDFFMKPLNEHNSAIKEEEDEFDIDDLERQLNDGDDNLIISNSGNSKRNSYEGSNSNNNNNMDIDLNNSGGISNGGSGSNESIRHSTITFKLNINPTITIVENETIPHTNCLKLKTKVQVYFKRDTNAIELLELTVKDTKMNIYRPLASQDLDRSQGLRSIQILKSVDKIYVKYLKENFTSIQWKQEITASLSPVKLFFSYQDVSSVLKIVNNINQALQLQHSGTTTGTTTPGGNNTAVTGTSPNDVSHMASSTSSLGQSTNSLMNTSTSSFNRPPQHKNNDDDELYTNNEKLKFSCSNISILFINESPHIFLPVAEVYLTEIESTVQNWSTELEAKTSMMIKGDYFNEFNMKFEPFIEDWSFNIDFKKNRHGKIRATFSATREIMNLNLSYSFIQSVHSALVIMKKIDNENNQQNLTWSPVPSGGSHTTTTTTTTTNSALSKHMGLDSNHDDDDNNSKVKSSKTEFHSHWLSNQTGEKLKYIIPKISKDQFELMSDSKIIPLPVKPSKNRDSTIGDHTKIDLILPNGKTIENLSLDSVGCNIYPIGNTGTNIVCDVKLSGDGSKTLWIKSMQQFENNTSLALEFKFSENGPISRVEKHSKFSLPLGIAQQFDRFWFKLENSPYWSELVDVNTIHNVLPDANVSKLYKLTTVDKTSLFISLVFDHRVDCKNNFYNTFSLYPPVQIENLLPYPFKFSVIPSNSIQKVEIGVGAKIDVYSYAPGTALVGSISDLLDGFPEIKHTLITGDNSSPTISKNFKLEHNKREVILDIERVENIKGIRSLSFYCQYWLMNNSLVPLEVKVGDHDTLFLPPTQPASAEFAGDQPKPILYTLANMKIKVANSVSSSLSNSTGSNSPTSISHKDDSKKFTPSFPICTIGHSNAIQYFDGFRAYEFCYRVDFCSNPKFSLSKIVTFTPRYVLYNNLPYSVNIAQYYDEKSKNGNSGSNCLPGHNNNNNNSPSSSTVSLPSGYTKNVKLLGETRLEPGQYKPFHWAVPAENKKIAIQPITNDHDHWRWSGGFFIDSVCDMVVRCRNDEKPEHSSILCHVNVKDKYGTLYVSMPLVTKDSPPYLIENDTQFRISVSQKDTEYTDYLNAGERMMYGWDEPSEDYLLTIAVEGKPIKKKIQANKIKATKFSYDKFEIYASISIEGPSRVILFSTSDKKYKSIKSWTDNSKLVSSQNQSEYNFYVRLTGIGLSLIDKSPKELAYISLTDLFIQATQSNVENTLEVKLAEMQIDNQLVKTEFPVLLHTTKVGANEHQKNDFLHVSIIKSTINNIDHFRYFSTLIQEMTVEIEDHWLKEVLDFVESLPNFSDDGSGNNSSTSTSNTISQGSPSQTHLSNSLGASFNSTKSLASSTGSTTSDYKLNKLCPPATLEPPSSEDTLKMVYFAILLLNPIKINLTLALQPDGLLKSNHKILSSIEGLGFSLTKLDRAPITLQGLLMEHPFSSRNTIIEKIKSSYITQVLRQFYNILGSIDILGNPVGLFRNFGTGVHDFFVEPAQGLIKSPADFGKGLAKGTSSLVKNSVYGTFNTLSKITGTIGTGVANLSFDDQYLNERKIHQARKPKHIGEGLAMGGIGLGRGLFQGLTGIVTKPVEGAKKGGVGGFAKGLVQGVVGVAVKPATAVIDLTTKTTEGIRNTTNLQSQAERVRPPRAFNQDKVLRPYDPLESEGWFLLKTSHKGKHAMDNYVWHHVINSELTIILSDQRLIITKNKKNILHSSFVYQIPYLNIKNVKMVPEEGILLELDPPLNLGLLDRDVKLKTIYVDNPSINMLLNMKLTHVLRSFNQEHPHSSNSLSSK